MAAAGLMAGEVWSWILESRRVGNPHMTYRVERLWWVRHYTMIFSPEVTAFWLAAAALARRLPARDPI